MVENTDVVNTSAGLVNITTVEMVRGHGWSNSVNVLGKCTSETLGIQLWLVRVALSLSLVSVHLMH